MSKAKRKPKTPMLQVLADFEVAAVHFGLKPAARQCAIESIHRSHERAAVCYRAIARSLEK